MRHLTFGQDEVIPVLADLGRAQVAQQVCPCTGAARRSRCQPLHRWRPARAPPSDQLDVARGGCLWRRTTCMPSGRRRTVKVSFPDGTSFLAKGEVKWTRDTSEGRSSPGMGLGLSGLDSGALRAIANYRSKRLPCILMWTKARGEWGGDRSRPGDESEGSIVRGASDDSRDRVTEFSDVFGKLSMSAIQIGCGGTKFAGPLLKNGASASRVCSMTARRESYVFHPEFAKNLLNQGATVFKKRGRPGSGRRKLLQVGRCLFRRGRLVGSSQFCSSFAGD